MSVLKPFSLAALALSVLPAMCSAQQAQPTSKKTTRRATAKPADKAPKATRYNHTIVPGASIGLVSLGESQASVRRKLGVPVTSFTLNGGLTSDLWRSLTAKRWDGDLHTFEVVYRRGVAIQIEATNPVFTMARGLGLKSSDASWERAFGKRDESKQYKYDAAKKDQGYDDWIRAGFALEYQFLPSDGVGDPPIQMHTLIVHYKGVPVIPDPGGV
jgi:hypothetical protein